MRFSVLTVGTIASLQMVAGARVAVAQASGKASPAAGIHACSLVSDADIQRITGRANRMNVPPDRSETPNGASQCNYVGLDISLLPRVTSQNFEANRKSGVQQPNTTSEPLSGVGEEAYYYVRTRSSSANVGVVFRVGTYQVALGDRVRSDSVAWFKGKAVELAKIAAAKLK